MVRAQITHVPDWQWNWRTNPCAVEALAYVTTGGNDSCHASGAKCLGTGSRAQRNRGWGAAVVVEDASLCIEGIITHLTRTKQALRGGYAAVGPLHTLSVKSIYTSIPSPEASYTHTM